MKTVIQRVLNASASVDGEVISSIGKGLCVLVGVSRDDTPKDIEFMVRKLLNLKFFEDSASGKRWSKNVRDLDLEILCLSQITLYHSTKGNKLDFHHAMAPEQSKDFYQQFLGELRRQYTSEKVKEGAFGKYIVVNIANDGPVTIVLDSRKEEQIKSMEEGITEIAIPD